MGDVTNEAANTENKVVTPTDPEVIKAMEKAQAKVDKKNAKMHAQGLTEAEISEMLNNIESNDMKILAQLLLEVKKGNDREAQYAKRQSIFSLCSAVLCLILVSVILIWGVRFVPTVEKLANEASVLVENTNGLIEDTSEIVKQANDVLADATEMLEQTDIIIDNLETITTDLAKTDIEGMMENVNSLVVTSEESIVDAVGKIEAIDFESLNKAIKDLEAVVSPLSKLFKK